MPIQRSRFHVAIQSPPNQAMRTEIVEPVGGFNAQRPATNLTPGETPFSQNWVMGDRYIEPRSGLSRLGSVTSATTLLRNDFPLYACGALERIGTDVAYVVSRGTIAQYAPGDPASTWTTVVGTAPASNTTKVPGTFYDGYYDHTVVFDAAADTQYLILTNWHDMPLKVPVQSSGNAASSIISSFVSVTSFARYVENFDDRLIFFSSRNTGAVPDDKRVRWSARGSPFDFTNGGFEDLESMKGVPSGMAKSGDNLALFSTREIWLARPRRDAFGFDFYGLRQDIGNLYPHSLQETAAGPIWLGPDNQFYRLFGSEVRRIGDELGALLETTLREPQLAFSVYDPNTATYKFFYSDTTGQYPTKALFLSVNELRPVGLNTDKGVWFMQDFGSFELAAAGRVNHSLSPQIEQSVFVVSSKGTPYRLDSATTSDDGTAIDCRWRSHALRAERDLFPYEALQECWLEYEYDSATTSTVSVYQSSNNGGSFTAVGSASLTSGVGYVLVPISAAAARNQMFELRLNDGSKPRLARMQLKLRGYTGRHAG